MEKIISNIIEGVLIVGLISVVTFGVFNQSISGLAYVVGLGMFLLGTMFGGTAKESMQKREMKNFGKITLDKKVYTISEVVNDEIKA